MRIRFLTVVVTALLALGLVTNSVALTSTENTSQASVTSKVISNFVSSQSLDGLSSAELQKKIAEFTASLNGAVSHRGANGVTVAVQYTGKHENISVGDKLVSTININSDVALIGVKWPAAGAQPLVALGRYLRGSTWSKWETIGDDYESTADEKLNSTEPWVVVNASKVQVALIMPSSQTKLHAQLELINPGHSKEDQKYAAVKISETQVSNVPGIATGPDNNPNPDDGKTNDEGDPISPSVPTSEWSTVAASNQPLQIYSRADWGANESWMRWRPRVGQIQGAVIHHTAGANGYSAGQVPGILRGIYRYHALSLGWGDIGYNVLVDNFGRAWQGRAGDIWSYNTIGAHATGVNSTTFGVSVLGNYSDFRPSDAAVDAVARLAAWKLKPTSLDATNMATTVYKSGKPITVPVVSGHRDVGPTACPGQMFYDYLPVVRKITAKYLADSNSPVQIPIYVALEQKQVSKGVPVSLAGEDRVQTSIQIAQYAFPKGSKTIYVARADGIADALAGGALTDGPIVLVYNNSNDSIERVSQYIKNAGATEVVALGGKGAVSDETLRRVSGSATQNRVGGATRVETSTLIAQRVVETNPQMNIVYLAESGRGIDALSAGSIPYGPVILVPKEGEIPQPVKSAIQNINPKKIIALGGEGAVSTAILRQACQGCEMGRLGGVDRYATALFISQYVFPQGSEHVYLASGTNPVDAVAGGVLRDGPILLLPNPQGKVLDNQVLNEIARLKASSITALGGEGAVAKTQVRQAVVAVN